MRIRTPGPQLHDVIEQLTKQLTAANIARNQLREQLANRDVVISGLRAEIKRRRAPKKS